MNLNIGFIVIRLTSMTIGLSLLSAIGYMFGIFPNAGSYWNLLWPIVTFIAGFACMLTSSIMFSLDTENPKPSKGIKNLMTKMQIVLAGVALMVIGIGRVIFNAALLSESIWKWLWIIALIVLALSTVVFEYGDNELETI